MPPPGEGGFGPGFGIADLPPEALEGIPPEALEAFQQLDNLPDAAREALEAAFGDLDGGFGALGDLPPGALDGLPPEALAAIQGLEVVSQDVV